MSSIRDFIPLSKLGQGTFSTVYKVQRINDKKIYALKKARMKNLSQKQKQNALNQIRILASLDNYSIVAYKEAFFDQKLNLLCVVMQYANKGDLQKLVQSFLKKKKNVPQKIIWRMLTDVVVGLNELHTKGIVHRDLKSANIFINSANEDDQISNSSGQIYKLGDLNVSKVNYGNFVYTQTGTPYYASPEVWRDEPYDSKSDIWSLGCILYEMTCFHPPFQGKDMQQLYKNVQNKAHKPIPQQYSYQLSDLIDKCLQKKANNRPNASQLLQHIVIKQFKNFRQKKLQQKGVGQNNPYQEISTPNINTNRQTNIKSEHKQLLQTIKLPTDMKLLRDKLPNAKYDSQNKSKFQMFVSPRNTFNKKNKSDVNIKNIQNLKSEKPISNLNTAVSNKNINLKQSKNNSIVINQKQKNHCYMSPRPHSSKKPIEESTGKKVQRPLQGKNYYKQNPLQKKINQSQIFLSPRVNIKNQNNQQHIYKTPNMHKKLIDNQSKIVYSDRKNKPNSYSIDTDAHIHYSQKKIGQKLSQKYTNFIKQQVHKKQYSIPKTQKQVNYSNSIHYKNGSVNDSRNCIKNNEQGIHNKNNKYNAEYKALQQCRKKLTKKSRVFSSNNHLKHYYAYPY